MGFRLPENIRETSLWIGRIAVIFRFIFLNRPSFLIQSQIRKTPENYLGDNQGQQYREAYNQKMFFSARKWKRLHDLPNNQQQFYWPCHSGDNQGDG